MWTIWWRKSNESQHWHVCSLYAGSVHTIRSGNLFWFTCSVLKLQTRGKTPLATLEKKSWIFWPRHGISEWFEITRFGHTDVWRLAKSLSQMRIRALQNVKNWHCMSVYCYCYLYVLRDAYCTWSLILVKCLFMMIFEKDLHCTFCFKTFCVDFGALGNWCKPLNSHCVVMAMFPSTWNVDVCVCPRLSR